MPFVAAFHLRAAEEARRRDRMSTLFLTVVCDTLEENPDYETNAMLRCVCVALRAKFASFGPLKACKDMMRMYSHGMRKLTNGLRLPVTRFAGHLGSPCEVYFLPESFDTIAQWPVPSFHTTSSGFHLCVGNDPTISVNLEFGCRIRIQSAFQCHDHEMMLRNVRLYGRNVQEMGYIHDRSRGTMVYTNLRTGRVIHSTFDISMHFPLDLHLQPWCLETVYMSLGVI